jgi:hypothetical protein
MDYNHKLNDIGFAGIQNSDVIIGRRNREILQNDLAAKYAINNR